MKGHKHRLTCFAVKQLAFVLLVLPECSGLQHQRCVSCVWCSGVYRSLQQSYSISSQDVLMAMDYCEESLQEIDVTSFLSTLCGHMRVFRGRADVGHWPGGYPAPEKISATFIIGDGEEEERPEECPEEGPAVEDTSEDESRDKPFGSGGDEDTGTSRPLDSPLELLQMQPKCEVYPDLHKIIQVSCCGKVAPAGPECRG